VPLRKRSSSTEGRGKGEGLCGNVGSITAGGGREKVKPGGSGRLFWGKAFFSPPHTFPRGSSADQLSRPDYYERRGGKEVHVLLLRKKDRPQHPKMKKKRVFVSHLTHELMEFPGRQEKSSTSPPFSSLKRKSLKKGLQ